MNNHILIVEDSPTQAMNVRLMLEKAGYQEMKKIAFTDHLTGNLQPALFC